MKSIRSVVLVTTLTGCATACGGLEAHVRPPTPPVTWRTELQPGPPMSLVAQSSVEVGVLSRSEAVNSAHDALAKRLVALFSGIERSPSTPAQDARSVASAYEREEARSMLVEHYLSRARWDAPTVTPDGRRLPRVRIELQDLPARLAEIFPDADLCEGLEAPTPTCRPHEGE